MKKIALIATMVFLPFFAQAQESYQSCVVQVLKNDRNGVEAHFVLACGAETIASHGITSFDQMGPEQSSLLKSQFMTVLKNLVNADDQTTCFETDSEIFWVGICHK